MLDDCFFSLLADFSETLNSETTAHAIFIEHMLEPKDTVVSVALLQQINPLSTLASFIYERDLKCYM